MISISKKSKKNKIFISFIMSYIFILMIPYAIGYFAYSNAIDLLTNKVKDVEYSNIRNLTDIIDYQINQAVTAITELSYDEDLRSYIQKKDPYRDENIYYSMTKTKKNLESVHLKNNMLKNITLYAKTSGLMLSSEKGRTYSEYSNFPYNELWGIEYEEMEEIINKKGMSYYFYRDPKTRNNKILLIVPVCIIDVVNPEGILIAEIEGVDSIISDFIDVEGNNVLMIVNENNEVLTYGKSIDDIKINCQQIENNQGKVIDIENKENNVAMYMKSAISSWGFVSIVDVNNYLEEVKSFKRNILIYVLLSSVVGIIISILLSRQKYRPIKKLKNMVEKYKSDENREVNDDYLLIENSIFEMITQMDDYKNEITKHERENKDKFVLRILKGWTYVADSNLDEYEIIKNELETGYNTVIIYEIDDFSNLFYEIGMDINDNKSTELIKFIIINVMEEYFSDIGLIHVIAQENRFIIVLSNKEIFENDAIEKKLNAIKLFLKQHFGIIGSFGLSKPKKGFGGMQNNYHDAIEVIEYKNMIGDQNTIIKYQERFSDNKYDKGIFSIEKEKNFINYIMTENFEKAKYVLKEALEEDVKSAKSLQTLKIRMFGIIDKMFYAVRTYTERGDYYECITQKKIETLINTTSIKEVQKIINKIFDSLIKTHKNNLKKHSTERKISKIIKFIEEYYNDPDLTVSSIADEFDISVSYLSKILKKEFNKSTLDFIHKFRINETKKLLNNTEKTLEEIAEIVGYYNYRTLVDRFKKQEGITPTQYREQSLK